MSAVDALWILNSISLPVWMIGAGSSFSSSSKGQELSRQAADAGTDVTDVARRKIHGVRDQLGEAASDSKAYAVDTASQIADSVSTAVGVRGRAHRLQLRRRRAGKIGNRDGRPCRLIPARCRQLPAPAPLAVPRERCGARHQD
jgi:hypothetical protein